MCTKVLSISDDDFHLYGYHPRCRKFFAAVRRIADVTSQTKSSPNTDTCSSKTRPDNTKQTVTDACSTNTRSSKTKLNVSHTGVLEHKCIFCQKSRVYNAKKRGGFYENISSCQTKMAEQTIKKAFQWDPSPTLRNEYGYTDFLAKEVHYHDSCKTRYVLKMKSLSKFSDDRGHEGLVEKRQKAYEELQRFIESEIFIQKKSLPLALLNDKFLELQRREHIRNPSSKPDHLLEKLKSHFGDKLDAKMRSKKEGYLLSIAKDAMEKQIMEVALYLRQKILQLDKTKFSSKLTADDLGENKVDTSEELLHFYKVLYTGTEDDVGISEREDRYIPNSADDDIYKTTKGRVKPSKHILLGMGFKSMVGSRKVLEVLNNFGHCIGYHVAEKYETALAQTIMENDKCLPDGLVEAKNLSTGLAWDNFDENTDILSGERSHHDTQGIYYQNIPKFEKAHGPLEQSPSAPMQEYCTSSSLVEDEPNIPSKNASGKRKRTLAVSEPDLEPVRRKLKVASFEFNITEIAEPQSYIFGKWKDVAWTLSCKSISNTPM